MQKSHIVSCQINAYGRIKVVQKKRAGCVKLANFTPPYSHYVLNGHPALRGSKAVRSEMTPREETDEQPGNKAIRGKRKKHLRVPVFDDEKSVIEANARQAGMSIARYLRQVSMGYPVRSVVDIDCVRELARINGDLARLGNLQKLWLDNDARTARFGVDIIHRLLRRIESTQSELRRLLKPLLKNGVSA